MRKIVMLLVLALSVVACGQSPRALPSSTSILVPPPTLIPQDTADPGPLPALIAQISLAPTGARLEDLLLDSAAGRLYVTDTAGQIHVLDAATYAELTVTPTLRFPTLKESTGRHGSIIRGSDVAYASHVFPDHNLLAEERWTFSGGRWYIQPPRFFDATTYRPITDTVKTAFVYDCRRRLIPSSPVDGRVYQAAHFGSGLVVYDLDGDLLTRRDNLPSGAINPNTGQMYTYGSQGSRVIDLATLSPLGHLPVSCIHTLDTQAGRLYALDGRDLFVFSERSGWHDPPPAGDAGSLPDEFVTFIQPSPDYSTDRTLFLGTGKASSMIDKIYRSTDGGQTWAQLHGGLPEWSDKLILALVIVLSPDFAHDHTLYAGGYHTPYHPGKIYFDYPGPGRLGEGVYRSTDGGDTWQPVWNGLTELVIHDIALSPNYAADGTLVARGERSVFRSTDKGLIWTTIMTATSSSALPPLEKFLPDSFPSDVRFRTKRQKVERTVNGGQTWKVVPIIPEERECQMALRMWAALLSPNFAADRTVYVLSTHNLFRSTDGGDTWEYWPDERLARRTPTPGSSTPTALAVSPLLDDGSHLLFVGTSTGEFWTLDPAALDWESVHSTE